MNTQEAKTEEAPIEPVVTKPVKVKEKKPETREETIKRLEAIDDKKITEEETTQLRELLEQVAYEKKRGALLHKLSEQADKWGRVEASRIRREVTDRVRVFSAEELEEIRRTSDSFRDRIASAKAAAKKRMEEIQEQLIKDLGELQEQQEYVKKGIDAKYKPQYRAASEEISSRSNEVFDLVAHYGRMIDKFSNEQLEVLLEEGTLQDGNECIAALGSDPKAEVA